MSARPPLVSMGLPVYNGEEYLAAALDSLLSQTLEDFELIISDNGSTDRTGEICRRYAERDIRIRLYREDENRGACWNFNRVFQLSRGLYFKWAAADDLCDPTFLARCVEILERDPTVVCCHSRTRQIDASGEFLPNTPDPTDGGVPDNRGWRQRFRRRRRPDGSSANAHRRFADVLLHTGWSARNYGLSRADALRRTNLIGRVCGAEKVLMGELSLIGRFHDLPEPLFFQRIHGNAVSAITSAVEQQLVFAGCQTARRSSQRLELLHGHLTAVAQSRLGMLERLRCYMWIFVYLTQARKWSRLVVGLFRGNGTAGANRKLLQEVERAWRDGSGSRGIDAQERAK